MRLPQKPVTRMFLMFSMFALMQCCCCVLPIRWRISNTTGTREVMPTLQPQDNPGYQMQEGSRSAPTTVDLQPLSRPEKGQIWIKPVQGSLTALIDPVIRWLQKIPTLLPPDTR